jgi:hypothetical protein
MEETHQYNPNMKQAILTFRFVPDFPFSAAFPLGGGSFSFGFTEKKPSNRPCCLAFKNFCNFSAPFLTRSSLKNHKLDKHKLPSVSRQALT